MTDRVRRTPSVRVLLLFVVLVPTVGMAVLGAISGNRALAARDAAHRLQDDVAELVAIIDARAATADEEVAASVLVIGADLGVRAEGLRDLYGVDFAAQLEEARAAVDADPVLSGRAALAERLRVLRALRPGIDAGTVSFVELHAAVRRLTAQVDDLWAARFERRAADDASSELPARVQVRFDALDEAYRALAAGSDRATLTSLLLVGEPTVDDIAALLDAASRFDAAVEGMAPRLGPAARAAWEAHGSDPAARRFEATLDGTVDVALTGTPSPLSSDIKAFGDAFIDGPTWGRGLTDTVRAAAADLRAMGADEAAAADRDLRTLLALAAALAVLSVAGAVVAARQVTRPIERLEVAAHQVHEGRFDLPALEVRGPRELADTAAAFNDMASTLAAVEAHAVALADDPEAPVLGERLPGRTGRALQVALNRLRSSMRMAERNRRELERAATHDSLTGLLNRPAATEVIGRDLSRVEREGGAVAAMFIDLDNLKAINDAHRHAAGDDALRLTADALRTSTRASDVVARLGGDEFLVAGVVHDIPDEIESLAHRIHDAVSAQTLTTPTEEVVLRCSIGIAVAEPWDTVESLIDKADAALYEAKRRGRDQITWHSDPQSARPPGEP